MVRWFVRLFTIIMIAMALWSASNLFWPHSQKLPCNNGALRAQNVLYCALGRHRLHEQHIDTILRVANTYKSETGTPLIYLDASGMTDRPLWPHRSHGSGDQLDLAFPYITTSGKQLTHAPGILGYGSYEPPSTNETQACSGMKRPADFGGPPKNRNWKLDEARLKILVNLVIKEPSVRRVFIEPHIADRIGMRGNSKVRFAGCYAARHDDHIHIDFHP